MYQRNSNRTTRVSNNTLPHPPIHNHADRHSFKCGWKMAIENGLKPKLKKVQATNWRLLLRRRYIQGCIQSVYMRGILQVYTIPDKLPNLLGLIRRRYRITSFLVLKTNKLQIYNDWEAHQLNCPYIISHVLWYNTYFMGVLYPSVCTYRCWFLVLRNIYHRNSDMKVNK